MSWREECEDASSRGLSFLPSEGDTRGSVEHGLESSKKLEPRRLQALVATEVLVW